MAKLVLNDIGNIITSANTINTNNQRIEDAIENTLSRDGTAPNEMNSDLDMNNHRIYNLPEPKSNTEPVRLDDLQNAVNAIPPITTIDYQSEVQVQGAYIPFSTNRIRTLGKLLAGDGGGAEFTRVSVVPSHNGYVVSRNGVIFLNTSDEYHPEMFGAGSDKPTATNTTNMIEWLKAASLEGRPAVTFPGKTYLVAGKVSLVITKPLVIYLSPGSVIKGASDYSQAVLEIDGGSDRPAVQVMGSGEVNSSLRTYIPAVASGTGLVLKRVDNWLVQGITLRGARGFGDSGIAAEACGPGAICFAFFYGHNDIGIYLTGGGSTGSSDDYGQIKVIGCHFDNCAIAVTARRQIAMVIMSHNTIVNCDAGLQCADATSGVVIDFQQVIHMIGNSGRNIGGAFIDLRMAGPGSMIIGNTVEDWGVVSAGPSAFGILGCTGTTVKSNSAISRNRTVTTHTGFSVNNYTDAGSNVFNSGNNIIEGNYVDGAQYGLRRLSVGDEKSISDNFFNNISTAEYVNIPNFVSKTKNGVGIGVISPAVPLHVVGKTRVARDGIPAQFHELELSASGLEVITYSDPASAKSVRYTATTDLSNTTPVTGNTDHIWRTRTSERLRIKDTGQVRFQPLSADPATRAEAGDVYYNSTSNKLRFYNGTSWADV